MVLHPCRSRLVPDVVAYPYFRSFGQDRYEAIERQNIYIIRCSKTKPSQHMMATQKKGCCLNKRVCLRVSTPDKYVSKLVFSRGSYTRVAGTDINTRCHKAKCPLRH